MKNTVNVTLNDLQLTIDPDTGSLLRLGYPGVGRMLDSEPDSGSSLLRLMWSV